MPSVRPENFFVTALVAVLLALTCAAIFSGCASQPRFEMTPELRAQIQSGIDAAHRVQS